jgi:hypothetical protein
VKGFRSDADVLASELCHAKQPPLTPSSTSPCTARAPFVKWLAPRAIKFAAQQIGAEGYGATAAA